MHNQLPSLHQSKKFDHVEISKAYTASLLEQALVYWTEEAFVKAEQAYGVEGIRSFLWFLKRRG